MRLQPKYLLKNAITDLAAIALYAKELQVNYREGRIAVQVPEDLPRFLYLDIQFLAQLPPERRRAVLAVLYLAAGKFPFERERRRLASLTNQNTAFLRDETRDDMNSFRLHISSRRQRLTLYTIRSRPGKRLAQRLCHPRYRQFGRCRLDIRCATGTISPDHKKKISDFPILRKIFGARELLGVAGSTLAYPGKLNRTAVTAGCPSGADSLPRLTRRCIPAAPSPGEQLALTRAERS
jgi:hypothetical protein